MCNDFDMQPIMPLTLDEIRIKEENKIIFRKMMLKDINAVYEIFRESIKSHWSIEELTKELYNDLAYYLVAEIKNEIIGFCGAWLVLEEAQITNIAVRNDKRNLGVGKLLFNEFIKNLLEKEIDVIYLEVRESNISAQNFYLGLNFLKIGLRKKFYSDGENAILMCLPIN